MRARPSARARAAGARAQSSSPAHISDLGPHMPTCRFSRYTTTSRRPHARARALAAASRLATLARTACAASRQRRARTAAHQNGTGRSRCHTQQRERRGPCVREDVYSGKSKRVRAAGHAHRVWHSSRTARPRTLDALAEEQHRSPLGDLPRQGMGYSRIEGRTSSVACSDHHIYAHD